MPDTDSLILNLLGPFEIALNGAPVPLRYEKLRALLAYMAVETGRPHRREALAALLWPESTDADARRNLSQALFNLRQALGDAREGTEAGAPYLIVSRESIQMNPEREYALDVARFRQLLAETARHTHQAAERCVECLARLEEAATLYRGDFLHQFVVGDSAAFEEWALLQRENLRQLALGALEHLVTARESQGDLGAARDCARRQLAIEPWREESHRHVMRLLAAGGQRNAALAQYEACRRVLADELAVEPAPETQALYNQIKSGELGNTARRAGVGTDQPARPAPAARLPRQPTPLFGRDTEIAAGRQQLSLPEVRLLTLTGPGGVGKTRLAVAIAENALVDFPDGVWFVDLAAITDAALVPSAVASTLGVVEAHGEPLAATLARLVGERRLLLVLDNFEQVLPAAGWVAALLESTRGPKVLVTSRERLRLRWERTLPVAPLPLPDLGQPEELAALPGVPSVALFVDRAQAANPSFRLTSQNARVVTEICAHLDGIPLALELAAARTSVLSSEAILQKLQHGLSLLRQGGPDLPVRHQTLQAAIDWSYDQLSSHEQQFFASLAVFRGGFAVDAAENIAATADTDADSLELLIALVDKSLVQAAHLPSGATRFSLLETLREYAWGQLQQRGMLEATRRRHAGFYLALAEETPGQISTETQGIRFNRLEQEHDNLRAALQWSLEAAEPQIGLRLAAGVWYFWWLRGHATEGIQWLNALLPRAPSVSPALRMRALEGLGTLTGWQANYEQGRALLGEALDLAYALEDQDTAARVMSGLGWIMWVNGRAEEVGWFAAQLDRIGPAADPWSLAYAHLSLGCLFYEVARNAEARQHMETALGYFRHARERHGVAFALAKQARMAQEAGEPRKARALARESLEFARLLDDAHVTAYCVDDTAQLVADAAEADQVVRVLAAAQKVRDLLSLRRTPREAAEHAALVGKLKAALGEGGYERAWSAGHDLPNEQTLTEALGLLNVAEPARAPQPAAPAPRLRPVEPPAPGIELSEREQEVLTLVAEGLSNQDIAARLYIAERTVRFHVTTIFNKLGANNRAQAVAIAARQGLV